jgi:colicin import membrane protein
MPGFVREHFRPLLGAVGLHALLFALIAATAWRWTSSRPPVPMAIEGVVVDERSLPPESTAPSRPAPAEAAVPEPAEPAPVVAEPALAVQDDTAAREREAAAQQERAEREAREQAARERARAEEAERAREEKAAADEAARKAAQAELERRKAAAAEEAAKRKAASEQQAREAELKRQVAAEEAAAASLAASGVVDEYRAELEQAIERSWIRPPSAQPGLACTLYVTQAPGGTVLDVRLGPCNGDAAVRESITNAVFRASPLPPPADPRAFARSLEIVFRPTE